MTRADCPERRYLMPLVHLGCEGAGGLSDQKQPLRWNNDFALGDQDAASHGAIPDAGISVSCILPDHIGDVKSRQAGDVRHQRFSVVHSHSGFPPPHKAREQTTINVVARTLNFLTSDKIRLRAASCSIAGTAGNARAVRGVIVGTM